MIFFLVPKVELPKETTDLIACFPYSDHSNDILEESYMLGVGSILFLCTKSSDPQPLRQPRHRFQISMHDTLAVNVGNCLVEITKPACGFKKLPILPKWDDLQCFHSKTLRVYINQYHCYCWYMRFDELWIRRRIAKVSNGLWTLQMPKKMTTRHGQNGFLQFFYAILLIIHLCLTAERLQHTLQQNLGICFLAGVKSPSQWPRCVGERSHCL